MNTRLLTALTLWSLSGALSAATDDPRLHEWGTFTSFQGADGVQLAWTPSIKTDLPDFVHSRNAANGGLRNVTLRDTGSKGELSGFTRMETPVIYLYSQAGRVLDVRVQFPNGLITEWYPQATRVGPDAQRARQPVRHG